MINKVITFLLYIYTKIIYKSFSWQQHTEEVINTNTTKENGEIISKAPFITKFSLPGLKWIGKFISKEIYLNIKIYKYKNVSYILQIKIFKILVSGLKDQ